jgi:ATP-dependent RNA helicase RhlE
MKSTLEQLKLSKQLLNAVKQEGFLSPTELQSKLFPRINGGQDLVAIGPEGSGKTTTCVLAALNKIKFTEEIAPRILYLVPDIETGEEVLDCFHRLNRNRDLRFLGLFADGKNLDTQVLELTDGVDVIVATPDRARAAYLKLGLNLNKILLFVIDDAEEIVKKGLTLPTVELARGIRKSQFILCTSVLHDRIDKLIETIFEIPNFVEVEDLGNEQLNTIDQLLYQVPNFSTKINLVLLLLEDKEVFENVLVIVNTTFSQETIYNQLKKQFENEVAVFNAPHLSEESFDLLEDFRLTPKFRVLVAANESMQEIDLKDFASVIHFDLPEDAILYTQRVLRKAELEQLFLTFCTDLELADVKKLEQLQGKKMDVMDLPDDLFIETKARKKVDNQKK